MSVYANIYNWTRGICKIFNLFYINLNILIVYMRQKIKQLFNANKIRLIKDDGVAVIFEIK